MPDFPLDDAAPRRTLVRRAAALGFGLAGLIPGRARAQATADPSKEWPGDVKGRHRQLFDAYEVNGGAALAFARAFIAPNPPGSATAVIVLRHGAMPLALNHATWAKYQIGEQFKIIDPETKSPAVKNPFLEPKPGVLINDRIAIDKLQADGALFAACNVALLGMSKAAAANAGVSAEAAAAEWAANLIPGVALVPSGTWAVNRAQEAGLHVLLGRRLSGRMRRTWRGSCHCGAVRFEVDADIDHARICDCSVCRRRGALNFRVVEADLRLLTPLEAMSVYRWGRRVAADYFCPTCGIMPFRRPGHRTTREEGGETTEFSGWSVNVRCLDGVDLAAMERREVFGSRL